ncbi:CDC27 family protein [Sulfurimonas microaerophilic]|uniref:CDC27 family protein n=1 Tax=Sulfurimonas microaerophilic TaxID=3058392 RepID=UPI0027150C95|nr:CDC27 family protein [Sulfurimonas sp. hsl 1-7]
MLNTRDLERRWLRYKIKSFLPHAVITVSVIIISISVSVYLSSDDQEKLVSKEKKNTTMIASETTTTSINKVQQPHIPTIANIVDTKIEPVIQVLPKENRKVVLQPSLDFMKSMQESTDGYYKSTPQEQTFNTSYVSEAPKKKHVETPKVSTTVEVEKMDVEESDTVSKDHNKIVIARKTSLQDIKDAEMRFKKNNSPALSLFLAKQYYSLGDYSKAYNYALVTNQLDKENEDSWILFSKSLVKLGKKQLAQKALEEYIKFSHSSNAELLLDDITTGEFR